MERTLQYSNASARENTTLVYRLWLFDFLAVLLLSTLRTVLSTDVNVVPGSPWGPGPVDRQGGGRFGKISGEVMLKTFRCPARK